MILSIEGRRDIAMVLAYQCQAGRGSCMVEGGCPFQVRCEEVQPWHWEKALGMVRVKALKRNNDEASRE